MSVIFDEMSYEQKLANHSNESTKQLNFEEVKLFVLVSGEGGPGDEVKLSQVKEFPDYVQIELTRSLRHKNESCFPPAVIVKQFEIYSIKTKKLLVFTEKVESKIICPPEKNYNSY